MKHVVVDLEMNPVSRDYREVRRQLKDEVIEIGAVCLAENYAQKSKFRCYVHPQYGKLRKHIIELTHITQDMVEGQPEYGEAFSRFIDWVGDDEDTKIYSWSMSDIKQLRNECRYKLPDFDVKWLDKRWIDLQQAFDDRLGLHNSLALKYALGAINHDFEGSQHTALDDAVNTSAILVLMQDDAKFREKMQPVLDVLQPKEELTTSIGDMFPDLAALKESLG